MELESPDSDVQLTVCGCIPCSPETKDTLAEMLDMSLFKDVIFILFTISNFLTSIGFYMPYAYLKVCNIGLRGIYPGLLPVLETFNAKCIDRTPTME